MLHPAVPSCDQCALGACPPCRYKPRAIDRGERLWAQGDQPAAVIFVKEGVLGLSATDANGRELSAGVRGPRSMLGLEGLSQQPARSSVVALTPAVVCSLPATEVRTNLSLREATTLLDLALDELAQSARDAALRVGPAISRVARFILDYGALCVPGARAPFSKRHIAELLDLRAETMSRSLRVLVDAGLIRPGLRVCDEAALEAVAQGGAVS